MLTIMRQEIQRRKKVVLVKRQRYIEEINNLHKEYLFYIKSKLTILNIIIPTIGVLIGFGTNLTHNLQGFVPLALFIVLNAGALITDDYTVHAVIRFSYIKVKLSYLGYEKTWFQLYSQEPDMYNQDLLVKVFSFFRIKKIAVIYTYVIVYLTLGLSCFVYSILISFTTNSLRPFIIGILGFIVLFYAITCLQKSHSREYLEKLTSMWHKKICGDNIQ